MRGAGEGSPPSGPAATRPRRPEERDSGARAGRGTADRQTPPAAHVVKGMEHGPDPHGGPASSSPAPVTVVAGAALGPAVPVTDVASGPAQR